MGNLRWILILLAALAALTGLALPKLAPGLVRRLTLALLGEKGRAKVGQNVLARQPDRITLAPHSTPAGAEAKATDIPPSAARGRRARVGVERKGFEPSTPTLRTWCSPS